MYKFDLLKRRSEIVVIVAVIIISGIYFTIFTPLARETKSRFTECTQAENDVRDARNMIELSGKVYGERVLMTEEDVSYILDELTRYGKGEKINFLSINPGEVKETDNPQYKVLPISIEAELSYGKLGKFLGALDDLKKGVVTVRSFKIVPDEDSTSLVLANIEIYVFLSGR